MVRRRFEEAFVQARVMFAYIAAHRTLASGCIYVRAVLARFGLVAAVHPSLAIGLFLDKSCAAEAGLARAQFS